MAATVLGGIGQLIAGADLRLSSRFGWATSPTGDCPGGLRLLRSKEEAGVFPTDSSNFPPKGREQIVGLLE